MSIPISYKYASVIRRLIAALLDGVLIGLFGCILIVGGAFALCAIQPELLIEGVLLMVGYGFPALFVTEMFGFPVPLTLAFLSWRSYRQFGPTADRIIWDLILCYALPLLIPCIYYHGLMESLPTKATLGKLAMGIFVSDLNGNKISFLRAMLRYLAKGISTLTCGFGYLMALGKTSQALHDKIAGSIVYSKE